MVGNVPPNGFFQFFQKDLTYQNRFLINSAGWSSVSSQAVTESVCDCDRVGTDSDTSDVTKHIQSDNTEPSEERSKKVREKNKTNKIRRKQNKIRRKRKKKKEKHPPDLDDRGGGRVDLNCTCRGQIDLLSHSTNKNKRIRKSEQNQRRNISYNSE